MAQLKIMRKGDALVPTGAYDRRITIQQPSDVKTAAAGRARSWTTYTQTWAHIEPWKGFEYWNAQQVEARVWTRMLIRYRPSLNVTPFMRVVYNNQTYNIRSIVRPVEARTVIEMMCEEIQAKGSAPTS